MTESAKKSKKGILKLLVLGIILAGLIAIVTLLPVKDYIVAILDWTKSLGVWGPVVVVLFYILACLLFLPGWILTVGAGFLFGVGWGSVTVSVGSTIGAAAAFLVGRTLARDWVRQKVTGNKTFSGIDEAIGKQGLKLVLLLRLSPIIPFNLLNYSLGLTKVPFSKYVLASWLGMIPGTVMYVYFGSAARSLTDIAAGNIEGGATQQIFFWIGLAATIIVATLVTRIAQKSLKEAQASKDGVSNA